MADTLSPQPSHDHNFDRLEQRLEQWRDHLTRLGSELSSGDFAKLSRRWDQLRQMYDIASLEIGLPIASLETVQSPLPTFQDLDVVELELVNESLAQAHKNLRSMLTETRGRVGLLEEILNSDKPAKMKKGLEKMRAINQSLQTRLLGLDAYIDQFRLAAIPDRDLLETTRIIMEQSRTVQSLTEENERLEKQVAQMKQWLVGARKELERLPLESPPSPGAMQQVSRSLHPANELDQALASLFSNRERLKDARAYLEAFIDTQAKESKA